MSEERISIHYIPTDTNPADIGANHLNQHRLRNLLDILSNFNVNDFNSQFNSSCYMFVCVCFESVLFVRINLLFL